MPFSKQPSNDLLKPSEDMVFGLELGKISSKRHSSSKTAKESSLLPQSSRIPKDDADKSKLKSDLKQKAKKDAEGKIENRESLKRSATQSDELVKHMSNLPGYLLRADKGDNSKEKAFNVGVLDWSRLEQWKHKHNHMPVLASNFTSLSSSGSSSSRAPTKSTTSVCVKEKVDKKKGLACSGIRPSSREWPPESSNKLPFENVKRNESSRSESIGDEQRMRAFESFGKTHSDISHEKGRRTESSKRTSRDGNLASSSRHRGVSHVPSEIAKGRDDGARQNKDGLQEYYRTKKERHHKSSSDIGSVRSKNKEVSVSSKKMSSSSRETREKVDQLKESDFDIGPKHKHCHSKPSNNVLLCPQEIPQTSSSGDFRLSEIQTSSDENISESSQSSLSYVSLPEEVCTEDVCSEIPHSSALCSAVEFTSPSDTMRHSTGAAHLDMDCSSVVSETPGSISKIPSRRSLGACSRKDVCDTNLRSQCVLGNIKESPDQEAVELTAPRGINTSHNRRFSFSLSRIGRSFSFKEGPALPQLNSIYVGAKSGPVTPESSVRWDNQSKEKGNSSRMRSSPLRRLLDPLLRHKASSMRHSAESSQAQTGSMNSINFTAISFNESLPAERSKGSSVQGLLQLTMKNGLPLFKFVLNNDRKILAATRRSLTSTEKDDIGCYFTFYLVNEIKKKSGGWMHHGSKEKSCSYAYNCIAQMKFSSSKITEPINQNSKRQQLVKEYVLLGVEIGQTEQGQPRFIQSGELAAVIIETPCENLSNEGMHSDNDFLKKGCLKCLADERCLCSSGEYDNSCSTTVILPGGVHGSPNKGEPSPLIYRWKTGGSCDCGGWDIGCKLLVLSNQKQRVNVPSCSKLFDDRFQLFVQEGPEQDTPLFTLSPLKDGFYSVEFSSSINYLQAFFISVAVLSCQKLPSSLEMGSMIEEILKEPSSKNNGLQGKAPIKYTTPIPPLSPVGRV